MPHMCRNIAILFGACILVACQGPPVPYGSVLTADECIDASYVCIRLENTSEFDFDNIFVSFPDREVKYGPLASGQVSSYRKVDGAYRYAYTEAVSGDHRFVLQPIDFVGENYIRAGTYTYRYSATLMDEPIIGKYKTINGFMGVTLQSDKSGT